MDSLWQHFSGLANASLGPDRRPQSQVAEQAGGQVGEGESVRRPVDPLRPAHHGGRFGRRLHRREPELSRESLTSF